MDPLLCLLNILSDFRFLFNSQNFLLFQAFIIGFIANSGEGTLTSVYSSSCSSGRYWSFPKFLSRGKWDADAVSSSLIKRLQSTFGKWVYVYDESKAVKQGSSQWGLHFFRNFSFQRGRPNQAKYHFGHQFGALGLLCETAVGDWMLFPVWVKLMCPQTLRDKSNAVFGRICSKIAPGLLIFDRGFARRPVFTTALGHGHHILCRAKSNAAFYKIPKPPKRRKPGRPKKYGDRIDIRRLRYTLMEIGGNSYSVASKIVRTKMCPAEVRIVVIRTRPKPSKPYRYFCVFTTDLTLEVEQIVRYYRHRWKIETAFRDVKQNFGFDKYQVKSRKSINRFVMLSFIACSLTKLIWTKMATAENLNVEALCQRLGRHWYKPAKLTIGVCVAYLRTRITETSFSLSSKQKQNSHNIIHTTAGDKGTPSEGDTLN